jgi:hypothetical protein
MNEIHNIEPIEICEELQAILDADLSECQEKPQDVVAKKPLILNECLDWIGKAKAESFEKGSIFAWLRGFALPELHIGAVIKALQGRYFDLFGQKISKGDLKKLIFPVAEVADEGAEEWCKSWVWIVDQAKFMHKDKLCLVNKDSFNALNGVFVPEGNTGKPSAVKYVFDDGLVDSVDMMAYLPHIRDKIVTTGSRGQYRVINTYDYGNELQPADVYTPEGKAAIDLVDKHINLLMGSPENIDIFKQWLAWQVQRRGEKLFWAPLIQSIEGTGKSFFGVLLEKLLGRQNVGTVSSEQVNNPNYNGWATGKCINILQELRVQGRNRYEVLNALKMPITDRTLSVSDKYIKAYSVENVTNYIAFTNYKDAIPLNEHDRRWWVVHVDIKDKADLKAKTGDNYFPPLFQAIHDHPREILRALMSVEITAEFEALVQAPASTDKDMMIFNEKANIEGYVEAEEMIEEGGFRWNNQAVCQSTFFAALFARYDYLDPKNFHNLKKNQLLKALGFQRHGQQVKIAGAVHRVWVKKRMGSEEIRAVFPA